MLGLVGAGGICVKLEAALGTLAWPKVTTLLVVTPAIALRYWIPYVDSCIGAFADYAAAFAGVTSSNIIVPHH